VNRKFFSFFAAIEYKHPLVLASTTTAMLAYLLQPSAGAMLQIISVTADQGCKSSAATLVPNEPLTPISDTNVTSTRVIGLNPTFATLEAFVSSAGVSQSPWQLNMSSNMTYSSLCRLLVGFAYSVDPVLVLT
jgi:hypothetical protein